MSDTITLIFYKGTRAANPHARLFDRLATWRTRGPYSHCELVLDRIDHMVLCWSSSFLDGGVRSKWIDVSTGRWDVVTFPGDRAAAARWFEAHQGEPYDWFALMGWVLPWRVSHRRWWFCSEACGAAIGLPSEVTRRLSPSDLYQHAQLEIAHA